jgi:hypothetical protein
MMKKRIIILSFSVAFCIVGGAIIRMKTNEPPDREIDRARKMISEAELVKSPHYAKADYQEAVKYFDTAMIEWRRENERFILLRDYHRTAELAEKSAESSGKAIAAAKKNLTEAEEALQIRIDELGERIKDFDAKFGNFPLTIGHRDDLAKSKLQYSEGVMAFRNKNYSVCRLKLDSVENTLNQVVVLYEEKLNAYLNEYPQWSAMVDKTLAFSKKNKVYCIVVDKLARECILYKDGKELKRFTVELGTNWVGDKNQQGDKSTPEGMYKITARKSNGQTAFYKALMLDYPNQDDKKRFSQNKKNGAIHPDANIGGLIEIHGDGGKGIDWTDGCIALKNKDLDEVFRLSPVGTWVTIVGSTKSVNELVL